MSKNFKRLLEYIRANPKCFAGALGAFLVQAILLRRYAARAKMKDHVAPQFMNFSEFLQKVESKEISQVLLGPETLSFMDLHGRSFLTKPVSYHPGLQELLHSKKIYFDEANVKSPFQISRILYILFPFAYLALCFIVFRKLMDQTGDAGQLSHRQFKNVSGARTKFEDVAGIDKAKGAVREVTEFMKNPAKFHEAGARIPSGILLVGPPGTGKTMLAKAMANEAGLPFFFCSGSDFVEVFAGRGASRIRKLFQRAAKAAPAVIFFDEIDALGKSRGNELSTNEEREQTLNQLLAVMDGFTSERGVIVMAATNRFDVLDSALTRPGRFDRIIHVNLPDESGRLDILKVHTRDMTFDESVDLELIAATTEGYSGAELAYIANEAAIAAVRDGRKFLCMQDFLQVLDEFILARKKPSYKHGNKGFMEHILKNLN